MVKKIIILIGLLILALMFYLKPKHLYIYKYLYQKTLCYNDIKKEVDTNIYKLSYYSDTLLDDTIIRIKYNSDNYKFNYKINLDKYDSIYYFGEYPMPIDVKRMRPELYKKYVWFYCGWIEKINGYLVFLIKTIM